VARTSAQIASVCPSTNVCFKLNIPANTASSGSGDVFFQISAPSTYEWVALGQGKGMGSSNMFLVYTSSSGTNVTLSPRTSSGYTAPTLNSATQVTLLEGSGVSNGIMTANVKCMYAIDSNRACLLTQWQAQTATAGLVVPWTLSHQAATGSTHINRQMARKTQTTSQHRSDNTTTKLRSRGCVCAVKW
jgi:hypothetical protein